MITDLEQYMSYALLFLNFSNVNIVFFKKKWESEGN